MTKAQKKNIKHLARLRRRAGERLMAYDAKLSDAFSEIGVDLSAYECGLNSVYLITEPNYCERSVLSLLCELEKGGVTDTNVGSKTEKGGADNG